MDPVKLRNYIMNIELNSEYQVLQKDINQYVQAGFQELLGNYKRLHVSNIPFSFREEDLVKLFKPFGPVFEVEIIYNERGSKGFGFLTMFSSHADKAFHSLNCSLIGGRRLEINNATPRKLCSRTPHSDRKTSENYTQTTPHHMQVFANPLTPSPLQAQFPIMLPHSSSQNYRNVPSQTRPYKSMRCLFPQ